MGGTTRTLSYQYDRDGDRTRITHPDATYFITVYDGLDRPLSLSDPTSWRVLFSWTDHGAFYGMQRINGVSDFWAYDGVQRIYSHGLYYPSGYTSSDVICVYGNNAPGQITSIYRTNDAYAWGGHYGVQRPYTTNGLNQYSQTGSGAGQAAFGYDPNGNLVTQTAGGVTKTYTYDVENRLVGASGGVVLSYDPLGRLYRVSSPTTDTRFLYDGDALVGEYNAAGAMTRRYVHGPGADVPLLNYEGSGLTQLSYLHADHQGSIVALSNGAGAPTAINSYDEYGIPAMNAQGENLNTGRFQYTGQIWLPELGMYHYKARVYSPFLGRFLQTDPVGYADQFNLYAYVGNDPVNRSDPTGLQISCPARNCPEIPRAPEAVRDRTVSAVSRMHIGAGSRETYVQTMVDPQDRSRVTEVRHEPQSGRPDPDNPMRFVPSPIRRSDNLGEDGHPHPNQGRSDERNMAIRDAARRTDNRNLYPSVQDMRHMNYTGVPFILKNTAGAILEVYRTRDGSDHIAIIRPGSRPLGPIPNDLAGIVVDP